MAEVVDGCWSGTEGIPQVVKVSLSLPYITLQSTPTMSTSGQCNCGQIKVSVPKDVPHALCRTLNLSLLQLNAR
jgi:hypothetical protein